MLVVDRTPTTFVPVYAQTHLLYYASILSDHHGYDAGQGFLSASYHT